MPGFAPVDFVGIYSLMISYSEPSVPERKILLTPSGHCFVGHTIIVFDEFALIRK